MANITLLPSAKVPLVYEGENTMTTEWYRFFWNIYGFTGAGVVPVNKGGTGLDTIGNHQIIIGNTNNVFEPASLSSSSITITYPAGFVNLELGTSGVTAGTYGSASTVGVFTVNQYGVLTAASNTSIGIDASQIISGTLPVTRGGTGATTLTGYVKGNGTSAFTASATVSTTDLSGTITNAQLANSTISGVALGGNLFSLTAGTGVSFSAGTTYNGSAAVTINATGTGGTVTSVAALTLGTTGTDLSSTVANSTTTPVITLNVPTASAANRGALSAADWTTFNSKAPGVTFTTGYVPFGQGTTTLNQSAGLQFDGSNLYTQTVRSYNASANISYVIGGTNNGYVDNLKAAYYRLYVSGNAGGQSLDFQAYIQASGYASRMIIGPTGGVSIGNTTDPGATNLSVTGSVNINSSPSAWGGGIKPLEFPTGGYIYGTSNTQVQIGSNNYYDGTNFLYKTSNYASRYYQYLGSHVWAVAPSGTAGNTITFVQAMQIGTNGGVSIGNTADKGAGSLNVSGLIYPQQATTAAAPAYVKGAIYFDTTLNKLRVGGATAWETITSA